MRFTVLSCTSIEGITRQRNQQVDKNHSQNDLAVVETTEKTPDPPHHQALFVICIQPPDSRSGAIEAFGFGRVCPCIWGQGSRNDHQQAQEPCSTRSVAFSVTCMTVCPQFPLQTHPKAHVYIHPYIRSLVLQNERVTGQGIDGLPSWARSEIPAEINAMGAQV